MDPIALTIIGVSITLTIVLVIIGIQIAFILKEFRQSVQKSNKMLDDAGKVTGTVSEGVTSAAGFVNGIRAGLSMITSIQKKGDHHE
ncbi:MAG TPA: hypothetical protein VMR81_03555 [Patescibacteria group bacterium]|jgi:hypothetical protein|nr:hypothetical protein [Patescibacteria group bacterium]